LGWVLSGALLYKVDIYVYIYYGKLCIYGICVFRVSQKQKRVQIKLRCCWWSLEHSVWVALVRSEL